MLDASLLSHCLVQCGRGLFAVALFLVMYALGARVLAAVTVNDASERLLLRTAAGFAILQFVVRWSGELPLLTRSGTLVIYAALALAAFAGRGRELMRELGAIRVTVEWRTIAILLLLVAPLTMALAPAVSKDATIYHLRFPELTLRGGWWGVDPANSASFYPSATSTLYVAALAVDRSGVAAQLVHFGFFILCLIGAAAIARRLGARTGLDAALLLAAVPAVGIVAGWSWSDLSLLFVLAAAMIAAFNAAPALALLFLGVAAAVKYNALLAAVPLCIAVLVTIVRLRAWKQLAAGTLLAVAAMSPWYVTNALRTGNPIYPLASSAHRATEVIGAWSRGEGASWWTVWSGYFLRPQTLDEDVGGVLLLVLFAVALRSRRAAAVVVVATWAMFLPFTAAMRLLLPAVAATVVVAGAVLESLERRTVAVALLIAFSVRGGAIAAAHNAHFMNPLPAAAGIEDEQAYVARNFAPAPLFARAASLPADARVISIHEVRLFRFPRPVLAARVHDLPILGRYTHRARSVEEITARLRADGVTHLLLAPRPVERGNVQPLPPAEERLFTGVLRASRVIDREGNTLLIALPR
ncbi:MAG TPA: hypothetical protein VF846_02915 [Thermoanaerobaculia bacterium]